MNGKPITRSCGECTTCCNTTAVLALNKPEHQWCTHCDIGKGCKIYETRPSGCKDFYCDWLKGVGEEDQRPDKTGIVAFRAGNVKSGGLYCIAEMEHGQLDTPYARRLINKALKLPFVVSCSFVRRRTYLVIPTGAVIHPHITKLMMSGVGYKNADSV